MSYINALRRNYYWRKSGRELRSGNVTRALGCIMYVISERRLIASNVR